MADLPLHQAGKMPALQMLKEVIGSIPDEGNKAEGYWATFGTSAETWQPLTTCEWTDRIAPKAWGGIAAGTWATYGWAIYALRRFTQASLNKVPEWRRRGGKR